MSAFYITGAGTEIGKTYVSAALLAFARAQGLSVSAVKPLMSGFAPKDFADSDAGLLLKACGVTPDARNVSEICLHAFTEPLAPNIAARHAGVSVDDKALINFCHKHLDGANTANRLTLIEGAGGVMSPATDTMLQLDLIRALGLPTILVAASYLGAISHCLTALNVLKAADIQVSALVLTQPDQAGAVPAQNADEMRNWTEVPIITAPYEISGRNLGQKLANLLELA